MLNNLKDLVTNKALEGNSLYCHCTIYDRNNYNKKIVCKTNTDFNTAKPK